MAVTLASQKTLYERSKSLWVLEAFRTDRKLVERGTWIKMAHHGAQGMHMAHNFSLQDSSLPRKKRAELAVKETGPKQSDHVLV